MSRDLPVRCWGGPHDGAVFPPGVVPWYVWVPRSPRDLSPPRSLTPEEALGQHHYRYAGVTAGHALHIFHPPTTIKENA